MLGICVVYLVTEPEGYDLLDLSVRQLRRTTRGPFNIFGCCPTGDAETLRRMAGHGIIVEPSERRDHISHEHSMLLDKLVDRALRDGCGDVVAFDMDSWPVREGWDALYGELLSERLPVAAMVRTEMGDNFPFAAFTYLHAGFWRVGQSSFSTVLRETFPKQAASLARRPDETGCGILAQLYCDNQRLYRLERTNRWDIHEVIAGVYDNAFFHLGAGSRTPRFANDMRTYKLNRSPMRRAFADRINAAIRAFALEQVLGRHDEFIAELAGNPLEPIAPIETDPHALPKVLLHFSHAAKPPESETGTPGPS